VTLTWNAANPNGSPVTTYQLSVNGGGWENVGAGTSTTRTGLANSTTYSFQVRAVNDVAPGAGSNVVQARTPGEPGQVGGVNASAPARHQVHVTWSAPPDNGKPITSYRVDIEPGGHADVGDRNHTFGGLADSTTYQVRVQACNSIGCGPWSGWVNQRTQDPPAPQVDVNWSKGASAQGQPGCGSSYCRWINMSASGLDPGQQYAVDCVAGGEQSGQPGRVGGTNYATAGPGGGLSVSNLCYFGWPNDTFWVTVGNHRSPPRQFGG
jgi:hypothetical protein